MNAFINLWTNSAWKILQILFAVLGVLGPSINPLSTSK